MGGEIETNFGDEPKSLPIVLPFEQGLRALDELRERERMEVEVSNNLLSNLALLRKATNLDADLTNLSATTPDVNGYYVLALESSERGNTPFGRTSERFIRGAINNEQPMYLEDAISAVGNTLKEYRRVYGNVEYAPYQGRLVAFIIEILNNPLIELSNESRHGLYNILEQITPIYNIEQAVNLLNTMDRNAQGGDLDHNLALTLQDFLRNIYPDHEWFRTQESRTNQLLENLNSPPHVQFQQFEQLQRLANTIILNPNLSRNTRLLLKFDANDLWRPLPSSDTFESGGTKITDDYSLFIQVARGFITNDKWRDLIRWLGDHDVEGRVSFKTGNNIKNLTKIFPLNRVRHEMDEGIVRTNLHLTSSIKIVELLSLLTLADLAKDLKHESQEKITLSTVPGSFDQVLYTYICSIVSDPLGRMAALKCLKNLSRANHYEATHFLTIFSKESLKLLADMFERNADFSNDYSSIAVQLRDYSQYSAGDVLYKIGGVSGFSSVEIIEHLLLQTDMTDDDVIEFLVRARSDVTRGVEFLRTSKYPLSLNMIIRILNFRALNHDLKAYTLSLLESEKDLTVDNYSSLFSIASEEVTSIALKLAQPNLSTNLELIIMMSRCKDREANKVGNEALRMYADTQLLEVDQLSDNEFNRRLVEICLKNRLYEQVISYLGKVDFSNDFMLQIFDSKIESIQKVCLKSCKANPQRLNFDFLRHLIAYSGEEILKSTIKFVADQLNDLSSIIDFVESKDISHVERLIEELRKCKKINFGAFIFSGVNKLPMIPLLQQYLILDVESADLKSPSKIISAIIFVHTLIKSSETNRIKMNSWIERFDEKMIGKLNPLMDPTEFEPLLNSENFRLKTLGEELLRLSSVTADQLVDIVLTLPRSNALDVFLARLYSFETISKESCLKLYKYPLTRKNGIFWKFLPVTKGFTQDELIQFFKEEDSLERKEIVLKILIEERIPFESILNLRLFDSHARIKDQLVEILKSRSSLYDRDNIAASIELANRLVPHISINEIIELISSNHVWNEHVLEVFIKYMALAIKSYDDKNIPLIIKILKVKGYSELLKLFNKQVLAYNLVDNGPIERL